MQQVHEVDKMWILSENNKHNLTLFSPVFP